MPTSTILGTKHLFTTTLIGLLLSYALPLSANDVPTTNALTLDECLRASVTGASENLRISELRAACQQMLEQQQTLTEETIEADKEASSQVAGPRLLDERMTIEALTRTNRFLLTPHKRNYLLPITYKDHTYFDPYEVGDSQLTFLKHIEAEFQLSVKILMREGLFGDNGHLYVAYTNQSFWQVYNRSNSRPFRETNHQPELILTFTNDWEILGFRNVSNDIIFNHQSNGQSGLLSRSWNRIILRSVFERNRFAFSFSPWYRIPESAQRYPGDPSGDDNPDIEKYLGHFELAGAYQRKRDIFSIMVRNNLRSNNYGAIELGWSFPLSQRTPKVRGYLKYFDGYGQSLIDYDDKTRVVGLGIIFTDLF